MKRYYACSRDTWLAHLREIPNAHGHSLEDDPGTIIFVAEMVPPNLLAKLRTQPDFHEMPLLIESSPLADKAKKFHAKYGVAANDTMLAAARKLAKLHPAFDP